jgi:hypothetical protein
MQPLMLARNMGGELQIDVCHPCHAIWFDRNESLQLAPGAVIELFRDINRHREDGRRPLAEESSCPHCQAVLVLTHDVVKTAARTITGASRRSPISCARSSSCARSRRPSSHASASN